MHKRVSRIGLASVLVATAWAGWGCHADEDDPAGQAEELFDSTRRHNAISNLQRIWQRELEAAGGDRSGDGVRAMLDASVEKLTQAYLEFPEDVTSGEEILQLLEEMRDPRSLPALIEAFNWRPGTETHAQSAAKALRNMEIPADQMGDVVTALGGGLEKVTQARPVDNRLRREIIVTLGALGDARARPILTQVMTRQRPEQNFLFNRLAASELAKVAGEDEVDEYVQALFMFDESNPQIQIEDVARAALVRIGRPSLEPLVQLLGGQNETATALAEAFIEAVRSRNPQAAAELSADRLVTARAAAALGSLGYREGLDPLLRVANEADDEDKRWNASVALVDLVLSSEEDLGKVRQALQSVYGAVELPMKPRLIAAMRQMYDPGIMAFIYEQAADGDVNANVRIEAVRAYALLANAEEASRLSRMIQTDRHSEAHGYRPNLEEFNAALEVAGECDENVDCWVSKLESSESLILMKAAYMLGRLGRGNDAAITALVGKLGYPDVEVRFTALKALDRIAVDGAPPAVERIDQLAADEEGTSIWNNFSSQALPIQSRLRNRTGG